MRTFVDENGVAWTAAAREEHTPRHHGRWYLVFHPAEDERALLAMPEVRWQTSATAARTLRTMSEFELRRRVAIVHARAASMGEPLLPAGPRALPDRAPGSVG